MHNMQVLCPYNVKDDMKAMLHSQIFELSESILKQLQEAFTSYIFTVISL